MLKFKMEILAGVALCALSTTAYAQDASGGQTSGPQANSPAAADTPMQAGPGGATTTTVRNDAGVGDIVVTARRRAENLQSVPISIVAVTDTMLREKSIATPYDLVNSTPGLAATAGSATRNDVQYFIRGQGATSGGQPSVVTYFADVPQQTNTPSGGSNINFYDLESVQVLKGPQGTLFGRSTTGGAVIITPKKPIGEFDGFFEGTIGNYGAREFTGAINVPIIGDRLALRVAGNYAQHNGYARSLTTGQQLDDRDRSSYRISLLARPTDWLTNTTIFTDQRIRENGSALVLGTYEPNGIARIVSDPRLPFNPALGGNSVLTGSLLDTTPGGIGTGGLGFVSVAGLCGAAAVQPYLASIGQSQGQCIAQRLALIDSVRNGLNTEAARLAAGGSVRLLPTTFDQFIRSRVQQVINTTELDLGGLGFLGDTSFKNIFSSTRYLQASAIREIQGGVGTGIVFNTLDVTYNPFQQATNGQPLNYNRVDNNAGKNNWLDTYSEEAQLSGKINDKHDWIIGFFTESRKQNDYNNQPAIFTTLNGAFTVPAGLPGVSTGYNSDFRLSQTGYFAQTTIDGSDFGLDGLRLTGGYRYSIVKNRLTTVDAAITPDGVVAIPGNDVSAKLRQTASSYTFALDYKLADRVLVYGTTRRGFKQGGINIQSVVPAANGIAGAQPIFGPEKVTDYEVGVKADYDLGGVSARTNVSLFTAQYAGLHRSSVFFNGQTTSQQILNVAGLRSRGIELEQTLRFSPAFTMNVAYAFLDSKFTSFPGVIVRPSDGAIIDRSNTPVTGAPKHKLDVAGRYEFDMGNTGDFVLAGNASYQSKVSLSDDVLYSATSDETQKGFILGNVRLDWNNVMGNPIDVSFFVKNVTNKTFKIGNGNLIASGLGTTTYLYGDPRIYGVQLRARFGQSAER